MAQEPSYEELKRRVEELELEQERCSRMEEELVKRQNTSNPCCTMRRMP